jgi:hypothetical protein
MENINLQQVDKTETRMTMDGMREGYPSLTVHVSIAWGRIILRKKKGALLDAVRNNLLALVKHAYKTEMQANDEIYIDVNRPGSTRHFRAVGIGVFRTLPEKLRQPYCGGAWGCRTSRCN